ncbi:MAG: DUF58 domain-containing protein [Bacillus sp. (in: Bacteria)]|nr:DUF58 domain-containing protein [Bacillus sp. (in: firmicutes)]
MILWNVERNYSKGYNILGAVIPVLMIISFISSEFWLFSIIFLLVLFMVLNELYLRYVTKHLVISNEIITKRMFKGDEATLHIPVENKGRLPIFNGRWYFFLFDTDDSVQVRELDHMQRYQANYEQNFSVPALTKRLFPIHIRAVKRGTAEIRSIELEVFDFFKFNHVRLTYQGHYKGEAIVYPNPLPIAGLEKVLQQEKGDHPQRFSFHEDVMRTIGNRDYSQGDPFNRINWKASAKTNTLQTKLYEKVTLSQWTLVINIQNPDPLHQTIGSLEEVLSHAAYACQFATKQQISFDMYINIKVPASKVGLYLPAGQGKGHLTRALEMLARIRKSTVTFPMDQTLYSMHHQGRTPPFVLHFGEFTKGDERQYSRFNSNMTRVYRVVSEEEGTGAQVTSVRGKNMKQWQIELIRWSNFSLEAFCFYVLMFPLYGAYGTFPPVVPYIIVAAASAVIFGLLLGKTKSVKVAVIGIPIVIIIAGVVDFSLMMAAFITVMAFWRITVYYQEYDQGNEFATFLFTLGAGIIYYIWFSAIDNRHFLLFLVFAHFLLAMGVKTLSMALHANVGAEQKKKHLQWIAGGLLSVGALSVVLSVVFPFLQWLFIQAVRVMFLIFGLAAIRLSI